MPEKYKQAAFQWGRERKPVTPWGSDIYWLGKYPQTSRRKKEGCHVYAYNQLMPQWQQCLERRRRKKACRKPKKQWSSGSVEADRKRKQTCERREGEGRLEKWRETMGKGKWPSREEENLPENLWPMWLRHEAPSILLSPDLWWKMTKQPPMSRHEGKESSSLSDYIMTQEKSLPSEPGQWPGHAYVGLSGSEGLNPGQ